MVCAHHNRLASLKNSVEARTYLAKRSAAQYRYFNFPLNWLRSKIDFGFFCRFSRQIMPAVLARKKGTCHRNHVEVCVWGSRIINFVDIKIMVRNLNVFTSMSVHVISDIVTVVVYSGINSRHCFSGHTVEKNSLMTIPVRTVLLIKEGKKTSAR